MWFHSLLKSLKFRPSAAGVRSAHSRPSGRLRVEALEDRVVPAFHFWTGAVNDLWSEPGNWLGGVPTNDEPGDPIASFEGNTSSVMDIVGLRLSVLAFSESNNTIALSTPLGGSGALNIQSSAGTNTIAGAQIDAPDGLNVLAGSDSTVIIDSPISGTHGLSVDDGAGTLVLSSTQSYSGTTRVVTGTLEVPAGSSLLNSPVLLDGGALVGGGTVATINGGSNGGRVAPGGGVSTQTLTAGNTFLSGVTYQPAIAGANSDRLHVLGAVDLTGSALGVQPVRTPTAAAYTLIDNEGTDPISGTFAGLPEGAAVFVAGRAYTISYVGGTGNDVVLTRAGEPTTPPVAPSGPPSGPPSAPLSQPAFSGAQVVGRFLVLTGASVPNGVQLAPVPLGSVALFTDVTSDGHDDVILFLPNATMVLDGPTGRFMGLDADDNGDGTRDLLIFGPDGTTTRIDGRTGLVVVF